MTSLQAAINTEVGVTARPPLNDPARILAIARELHGAAAAHMGQPDADFDALPGRMRARLLIAAEGVLLELDPVVRELALRNVRREFGDGAETAARGLALTLIAADQEIAQRPSRG